MGFLKGLVCCLCVALLPVHYVSADDGPLDAFKGPNGETVVYLVGAISGETAARVITQVKAAPPGPVRLVIMSPGGEVGAGYLLLAFLRERPGITCDAVAAMSMAAILFESDVCASRVVHPETVLMFHSPSSSGVDGTADDIRRNAESLDTFARAFADLIAPRLHMTSGAFLALTKGAGQVWVTGTEALALGWADELRTALAVAP